MRSKATARPWTISGITGDGHIMAGSGKSVCIVTGWPGITDDEWFANRELIFTAANTIDAITAQRDALLNSCRAGADWLARSIRADDQEVAKDMRVIVELLEKAQAGKAI